MKDTYFHYFTGAFPESYRKPSVSLTEKIRFVTIYTCVDICVCDSRITRIRTVLANVENAHLLCGPVAIELMYYVPSDDLQRPSDYQRHTCPTI
jgi:hypothetical protein